MSDITLTALEKNLDLRMKAHEIHTSNIANANVPNYKAKKIDFDHQFREVLDAMEAADNAQEPMIAKEIQTNPRLAAIEGNVYEDPAAKMNGIGNTVKMEKEQAEMAKNTIAMEAAMKLVNKKLALQKYVVGEGSR